MTKVKICGLKEPETLTAAINAGADFIGFVFYKPSPRYIDIEVAKYLSSFMPANIELVGLFVDPSDDELLQTLNEVPLTMIQLHGHESPERVAEIKNNFKLPIIKALSISSKKDLEKAKEYESICDWLLFDAQGEESGGNGKTFDWGILKNYKSNLPWMLAGGLTPQNVAHAIKILSPDAVDVSSGVESVKGIKDASKIRSFLESIKKA